ncbi:MAG: hypothetical protein MJ153_06290, partial [Clostridia bacterium]|nr:hypothetical protein [Clostridia bacterium]
MKKSKLMSAMLAGFMFSGSVLSVSGCSIFGNDKDKNKNVKNEVVELTESDPWFDSTRVIVGDEFQELGLEWYYFNRAEVVDDKIIVLVNGFYPYEYDGAPKMAPGAIDDEITVGEDIEGESVAVEEIDDNPDDFEDVEDFED